MVVVHLWPILKAHSQCMNVWPPRQRRTQIQIKWIENPMGICVGVCLCTVQIFLHNSTQARFYRFLHRSRYQAVWTHHSTRPSSLTSMQTFSVSSGSWCLSRSAWMNHNAADAWTMMRSVRVSECISDYLDWCHLCT